MDNSRLMRGRGPIFTLKIFAGEETGLIPSLDVFWSLTSICIPLTKAHEREDSKGTLPLVTDSISLQMQKQRFEVCLDCCAAPLPLGLGVDESGHLTWEMELVGAVVPVWPLWMPSDADRTD